MSEMTIRGSLDEVQLKLVYIKEVINYRKTGGWGLFQSDESWRWETQRDTHVCPRCAVLEGAAIAGDVIPRDYPDYEMLGVPSAGAYTAGVVIHPHLHLHCRCRLYLDNVAEILEARLHREKIYAVS